MKEIKQGIIKRVSWRHGRREYELTDGSADFKLATSEALGQGMVVSVEGESNIGKIAAVGEIAATKIEVLSGEDEERAFEKIKSKIAESINFPDKPNMVRDEPMIKLWPAMKMAALELMLAKRLGRPVLLRFHGDADGISGAFAITSILPCKAFQQNSAVYSVKEALRDMAFIGQEGRPLIILLDFASNEASKEGLGLLEAGGIDYLVIDHHPYKIENKRNKRIVNPAANAANTGNYTDNSKYTAGYLASEIAILCGLNKEKAKEFAAIACSGDKSQVIENSDEERKKALVLDFLASHISYGNNLEFYKKVIGNDELFQSIAQQADEAIEDAAKKAMRGMKKIEGKATIATFNLKGIAKKKEWPPSSKITTYIFDKLKGKGPLICIGYTDRTMSLRLNDGAIRLGLSANIFAEKLKASMGDFIEGGGGHARAGAIRVREGFVKEVLSELLKEALATVTIG